MWPCGTKGQGLECCGLGRHSKWYLCNILTLSEKDNCRPGNIKRLPRGTAGANFSFFVVGSRGTGEGVGEGGPKGGLDVASSGAFSSPWWAGAAGASSGGLCSIFRNFVSRSTLS